MIGIAVENANVDRTARLLEGRERRAEPGKVVEGLTVKQEIELLERALAWPVPLQYGVSLLFSVLLPMRTRFFDLKMGLVKALLKAPKSKSSLSLSLRVKGTLSV